MRPKNYSTWLKLLAGDYGNTAGNLDTVDERIAAEFVKNLLGSSSLLVIMATLPAIWMQWMSA
jgi:hypothetical protein